MSFSDALTASKLTYKPQSGTACRQRASFGATVGRPLGRAAVLVPPERLPGEKHDDEPRTDGAADPKRKLSGHELGDADPQDAEYIPREQATLPVHYRHDGAREQRADAQVVAVCGPYLRILKPAPL